MGKTIRGKCVKGHEIEVEFPKNYNQKGPLIENCPGCGTAVEISYANGTVKPYHHPEQLSYPGMNFS